MKRRSLLAICLAAVLLLAGCGGGGAPMDSAANQGGAPSASTGGSTGNAKGDGEWGWDMNGSVEGMPAPESPQEPGGGMDSVYQNTRAKLIRRANLEIQTEQFDESAEVLNKLVASCGGYFENAAVYGGIRRDAYASRRGEYIIRVPAEKYDQFLSGTGDLGYVISKDESSEDVGERYYDTEARLKTQRTKQERLLALLEKAETMEDIISLESALSDVEYQIEQLSSDLNRYDALISFATFNVYLYEVGKVTEEIGETASLGQRMAAGFQSSFQGLVRGSQEFLVWVSYNLVLTAILAAAAVVAVIVGRRELVKLKKKREKTGETEEK